MHAIDSALITRTLEMQLDQLYYWARRAKEQRDSVDSGLAGRMLEAATANLETFMGTLLDYFRPLQLTPTRTSISDLVSSIAMRARNDAGATSVIVSGGADGTLAADVAQLARALSAILRRLDPNGAALHVAIASGERGGRCEIEIVLRS